MARKIAKMTGASLAKAKPTAVPRKGAEHGVASTTASRPSKKERRAPTACAPSDARRAVSMPISKTPKRFRANTTSTLATTATKSGSWNWKPQPTAVPALRSATTTAASAARLASNAGEVGESVRERFAPSSLREVGDGHGLEREHGQHARHQIEDQAAEQRQRDRLCEARRAARHRRGGRGCAQIEIQLDALAAAFGVDEREHAGEPRRFDVEPPALEGHAEAAGAVGLRVGAFELDAAAAVGEERVAVGGELRAARFGSAGTHAERSRYGAAGRRADSSRVHVELDVDAERRRRPRDPARGVVEEHTHGVSARGFAETTLELEARGDAFDFADEQVGVHARDPLSRRSRVEDRAGCEQHTSRVAVGREEPLRLRERGRRGPRDRLDHGARDVEAQLGRETGLTRVAPVEVPARVELEEHTEAQRATLRRVVGMHEQARDDARFAVIEGRLRASAVGHRERVRSGRRTQRQRRPAEQEREQPREAVRSEHRGPHRDSNRRAAGTRV